ncbi:MAG: L,D-transpeptidase family protein [Patescibacteria group bacterium]
MKGRKILAFLLGGVSVILLEGILIVSFFVFWRDAVSEESGAQEVIMEETPALIPLPEPPRQHIILDRFAEVRNELIAKEGEFLEINFSEDKVFKYENGKIAAEAPILKKGDPQGWGGTPAGLYNVLSQNKVAFSGIAQVYMPYAISFYGKYYLHGEPYYPGGEKTASDISGGCIQLKNESAEKMYELVEQGTPVFVVDKENDGYVYDAIKASSPPYVSATNYLIADVDSGFVFAEKNSQEVHPIASIAKLMTALVVAENVDLRKSIVVTPAMLQAYGETEGLEEGERYRIVELFYPLLIASSNDAAEAVAGFLGRDRTIQMMNEKAKEILLANTVFTDPTGFDSGNVSSAQDLFYLARYIVNNRPPLLEITRGREVRSYGPAQFSREELWNKNVFVADSSFVGGKTGYTTASKHTGAFLFRFLAKENEIRTIAFVLLGSQDSKLDTQLLYSWVQRTYQLSPDYSL